MKLFSKTKLLVGVLTTAILSSFVGGIAGTLSWYAYVTRVSIGYRGTSVTTVEQLQIGLKLPTGVTFTTDELTEYGLISETHSGVSYVFSRPGAGMNSDAIAAYLKKTDYAVNTLEAVTSKAYANLDEHDEPLNSDISLWRAPYAHHPEYSQSAGHSQYVVLPFAFHVLETRNNELTPVPVKNQKIWINHITAEADGEGDISKALRVHSKGNNGTTFLLNPSADESGSTVLAGLLDLDKNGYYDVNDYSSWGATEIIYGEYSYGGVSKAQPPVTGQYAGPDTVDDVNHTGYTGETTFSAKHHAGAGYYANLNAIDADSASWYALEDIKPNDDGTGALSGGLPVAVTTNDTSAIATATMTIYLEGWDHTVIDTEIGNGFNLGIQFAIDKIPLGGSSSES